MKVGGSGTDRKSFKNAEQKALIKCQKESKLKKLREDGCLLFELHGGSAWEELLNKKYREKNYWNESVDIFEKTLKSDEIIQGVKFETNKEKKEPKNKKPDANPDDNKIIVGSSGSGFFVSREGHLISNFHVIDRCNNVKINFKGDQLQTKILAIDKVNDIAILKVDYTPINIFSVSNNDVSLLEDIIVAGFPKGKKISSSIKTSKGVVTALAGVGDNYSEFQTDTVINAGNSGGPIVNQNGNVVGIAVSSWIEEGVEGIHFGIKSSTLKTFASANGLDFLPPNNKKLSNKDLGKLITEATVYLECHMTVAKYNKLITEANNRKAFFSEEQ